MKQIRLLPTRWDAQILACLALLLVAPVMSPAMGASFEQSFKAEIRTTSYGVPHILARDYGGLGFGLGYAFAKADICSVAERWVTVNAERSKYFGPDAEEDLQGRFHPGTNLESDFFWKRILDTDVVGKELAQPAPLGPTQEVRDLALGYAAGYNRYLQEVGVDKIPDTRCRGQAWVRPITDRDVYLRALHWNLFASSDTLVPFYVAAAPPGPRGAGMNNRRLNGYARIGDNGVGQRGPASNMIALGKDATDNGKGMMFINPHFYWHGPERWYEAQLTIPGKLNVYGASLAGTPVTMFGFNENVAWSHTSSVPKRYTIYRLKLSPNSPTSYIYDGAEQRMTPRTVTVSVKLANGLLEKRSHVFWETQIGLVMQNGAYPWSRDTAYAVRDVAMSFRWLNQELANDQAKSVADIDRAGQKYLSIGWLNTMATDSKGNAIYRDQTAIPYITDSMLEKCITTEQGRALFKQLRLPLMDGGSSKCQWQNDIAAPVRGIFGPENLPKLDRADYVTNSNDSYWTNNLHKLLEGYPLIMGDERTPRSLRTRLGLEKIEKRLSGTDGLPGNKFTLALLEKVTMDNRVFSGEIWRDQLVTLCRQSSDLQDACNVLANWDLTENTDSVGAVLWQRFYDNLILDPYVLPPEFFAEPFDPKNAMNTPNGLNIAHPNVEKALRAAVSDLREASVPFDAKYGDYFYVTRNGKRIPLGGGTPSAGQYNFLIGKPWQGSKGWTDIDDGSSFVAWVQFTDNGPVARSVMTYSQSDNDVSMNHSDQTELFSRNQSKPVLFDEKAISGDPNLVRFSICSRMSCN